MATLNLNGKDVSIPDDPRTTLLDFLHQHLSLFGTKKGCDHGQCGACTVIADGKRINACLVFAFQLEGAEVTTCLLYTSPSPRDLSTSRMPSSA